MNENLNLVEILKDCPKGTKLYSMVFGDVKFNKINITSLHPICITLERDGVDYSLAEDGRIFRDYDGECILFPSKDQRDWSKFKVKSNKQKFDPKTLHPFDKVLVRDSDVVDWKVQLFSRIIEDEEYYPYVSMNLISIVSLTTMTQSTL